MIQLDEHNTHIIPAEHFSCEDTAVLKNGQERIELNSYSFSYWI